MTNIRNTSYAASIARAVFGPVEVIALRSIVDYTRGLHEKLHAFAKNGETRKMLVYNKLSFIMDR